MSETEEYGPAMQALNERQRAFVMALIEFPGISLSEAARRAGYIDTDTGAIRVRAHYCAHNPAVQAAMREEAGKRLNATSLTAANVLLALLTDDKVEPKDRIKAAGMLLDRSGFGAAQTINVNKTTTDRTGKAIMERIAALSQKLGVDASRLLGPAAPAVVEGEFSEVKE
jgi:phage terminase small subunit